MESHLPQASPGLQAFLEPLRVDCERIAALSREFASTFTHLAAQSTDQFLPTPISETLLLPLRETKTNQGRHLAIDIGGTNLRVGFIELLGDSGLPVETAAAAAAAEVPATSWQQPFEATAQWRSKPNLRRLHDRSWPIQEHLKSENADRLFAWIGTCIASVVQAGCSSLGLPRDKPLPMGVTFSFPMEQASLSEAKLMSMGKGFAISSQLDLGSHLVKGYEEARSASEAGSLPPITVVAIANDAVSTLISFMYETPTLANQKAAMGVICGTGCNATLLLKRSKLHPSKQPKKGGQQAGGREDGGSDQPKIAVNTEWSINGSEPAMRAVNLISRWDDQLSATVECPGFQPLEYMTAGRYLGELGRVMLVDYMTGVLGLDAASIPRKFLQKFEPRNTTFLSRFRPGERQPLLAMLEAEFPTSSAAASGYPARHGHATAHGWPAEDGAAVDGTPCTPRAPPFCWTEEIAEALYHIAKAIETRAAGIVAAAIVGLLDCADELPPAPDAAASNGDVAPQSSRPRLELVVGYTGGCITNFQDYLADCQAFLDTLMRQRYSSGAQPSPVRVVLSPCHDGGIKGAGILVPAALASQGLL